MLLISRPLLRWCGEHRLLLLLLWVVMPGCHARSRLIILWLRI
jgi:hypothetical protein